MVKHDQQHAENNQIKKGDATGQRSGPTHLQGEAPRQDGFTNPAVIQSVSEHVLPPQWPGGMNGIEPIPRGSCQPHTCPADGFCDKHPPTLAHEQFEMDGKRRRFQVLQAPICKHNVKKCMQSYQSLPARTRQSLRIAGILLISAIAVTAVFYLTQLGEETEGFGLQNVVIKEKETISLSLKPDSLSGREIEPGEDKLPLEYSVEKDELHRGVKLPPKIIKDADGKAKEYEKENLDGQLGPIGFGPPIGKTNLERMEAIRKRKKNGATRPATPEEVQQTLELVRKTVDSDRKLISDKELRFWETGSEPLRVLLVSTWRSGSTFLAQTLYTHPGVFEHHEPLSFFGVRQIRSGKDAFQTQQLLHRLLDCNYDNVGAYLNYSISNPLEMLSHNNRVWKSCTEGPIKTACYNKQFLSDSCKMFPIQLVKTVRMRLNATQLLLNDDKLRVKVIFLVRDPRGTMSSRYSSVKWCKSHEDCSSPAVLCQDLEGDLKVAKAFESLYPDRFIRVKYEDLSTTPDDVVEKIFSFLGIEYGEVVKNFVYQHTHDDKNSPWSTSRKSSDRISLWKKQLKPEQVYEIQDACSSVLETLKYDVIPK